MDLGTLGVFATPRSVGEEKLPEAARVAEELGYGTFWLGASPKLAALRPLLEATETIVVATGIVNVWANEPAGLAAEYAELTADFGERFLVGIGIGHREQAGDYAKPLTAMRAFLDGLDSTSPALPRERRILAALAPKMVGVAGERSLGAFPYFAPVAHTAWARGVLGPDPLLVPELTFVLETDAAAARALARPFAGRYLGLTNYANNLLRHGFDEADLADGGSDRLLDALVPHGDAEAVAAVVRAHLDTGADHVALQALTADAPGVPRRAWAAVAAALMG